MSIDIDNFIADVLSGYTIAQLAVRHGVSERTIKRYKQKLRAQGKLPPQGQEHTFISEGKINYEEDGNYASATSHTDGRIRTLEQLKEAAEIDETIWEVTDHDINKWEVGAKIKEGALTWDRGVQTGHIDYKGLKIEELWQVKAKLRRRKLQPLTATIQPVSCPTTYRKPTILSTTGIVTSLLWADPHFGYRWTAAPNKHYSTLDPFHDREALDLWLQIAEFLQPHRIDILGDWFDATSFSDHFITAPDTDRTTQPAILESHWWLRQFRIACPDTEIRIHPGNHDDRIIRAIKKHLPVAYRLHPADELELPPQLHPARLLALHQLGIEWVTGDYKHSDDWIGDTFRLHHGYIHRSTRSATVKKVVEDSDVNTIQGHGHRSEHTSRTRHFRNRIETISSYALGCTCRIDNVLPSAHKALDWQQSAAILTTNHRSHSYTDIAISTDTPKTAIVQGNLFQSRDRLPDLRNDIDGYPW